MSRSRHIGVLCAGVVAVVLVVMACVAPSGTPRSDSLAVRAEHATHAATVVGSVRRDVSQRLSASAGDVDAERDLAERVPRHALASEMEEPDEEAERESASTLPSMTTPTGSADVEQTAFGTKKPATLVASFDGLGVGFTGPQGTATTRNPSDNTLAVGPDHVVQIVNTRMAIFTKKGKQYDTTGRVLFGPVETRNVFKGFGGGCEARNNGDAVARYDQLADRWLIVMPIFSRLPVRQDAPPAGKAGEDSRGSPAQRRASTNRHRLRRTAVVPRVSVRPASARRRTPASTRCAMRSASVLTRSGPTTGTSSYGHSSPTTHGLRCGPTATMCPRARATRSFRSTPASSIARRC